MVDIINDLQTITLGALGAGVAILATGNKVISTNERGFRTSKIEYWLISVDGKTTAEGPIEIGIQVGLTVGELAQAIAASPTGISASQREEAQRAVWPLGVIGEKMTSVPANGAEVIGDIMNKMTLKLNWSVKEGQSMTWYAMNRDSGALTTGTVVKIRTKYYGVFLND